MELSYMLQGERKDLQEILIIQFWISDKYVEIWALLQLRGLVSWITTFISKMVTAFSIVYAK